MLSAQERKTYYEILDAAEANKLYQSLKTDSTHTPGWPIPTTAVEGKFLPSRDYLEIIETEWQEIDANNTLVKARISAIKLYPARFGRNCSRC